MNRQNGWSLRVLMQIRPNVFSQRGGDTKVLERLSKGLMGRGVDVQVDIDGSVSPVGFDIVHLFNFATPALTQEYATRAKNAGVPYVVTTLYEDVAEFHYQSHYVANKLIDYVRRGQVEGSLTLTPMELAELPRAPRFSADEIARYATALFPNGKGEANALRRDFPQANDIREVPVGYEIDSAQGPEMFERAYGIRDFVLCVGRLESRKNQLMLLKALETSELPVVLAAGGFSYQPEYEAAVRAFKRSGKTVILERIDTEMLSSAYAACRAHVLPSWYELPGLVTLEAASRGKNIVVTRTGTTADYVTDKAFYCAPWDADSIASAVFAAYYSPAKQGLIEMATSFSWENAINQTIAAYAQIVGRGDGVQLSAVGSSIRTGVTEMSLGFYDMSINVTEFQDELERGEIAAKVGDFALAEEHLRRAEVINPTSARTLKALGAVLLATMRGDEARELFDRALDIDSTDPKILAGRGMCEMISKRYAEAMPFFEKSVSVAPDYLVAIHQLLECSYALSIFDRALVTLERYLSIKPLDVDMRFCLAGCLHKVGQSGRALTELDRVMTERPGHDGAQELYRVITASARATESTESSIVRPTITSDVPAADLKISLTDLSERIRSWKVGPSSSTPTSVVPTAPETTRGEKIAAEIGYIEELKRLGDFETARTKLGEIMRRSDLEGANRENAQCLDAEFTVLAGELAAASRKYDAILTSNPHSARAICGKGALAAEGQDWSGAKMFFLSALKVKPRHDVALAGLGLCAMVENRHEEAFSLFQQAVEVNPENHRALLGVLQTGYPLKKFSEMERMISAYLDLHPGSLDMLYSFAGVLFAQGKVKEARLEVEKILVFEPSHEHALELRSMIDQPKDKDTKAPITQ
jgi:tetratricopeptide (TPR) repeat protein